ncbi:MAG: hypothetical protein AAFX00_00745, partial [Pseudomonadota bacterium]
SSINRNTGVGFARLGRQSRCHTTCIQFFGHAARVQDGPCGFDQRSDVIWNEADAALIEAARAVLNPRRVTEKLDAGRVASALTSKSGKTYTGVSIDAASSVGFCAEHAAVAAMLTAGENRIDRIVAVNREGAVKAPCGRCRELMRQMGGAKVLMPDGSTVDVHNLLPGQRPVKD